MSDNQITIERIEEVIKADPALRAAISKVIARDYPAEYLANVSIEPSKLTNLSAQFISSNKEWNE